LNQTPRSGADTRPRFVRAYVRRPLNQSGSGDASPGEFDLVLELGRYVELDDFQVEEIAPTAELLATRPEPRDGDRPRSFREYTLQLHDGQTTVTLRRFYVVLIEPKTDPDGNDAMRPARIDELYAARPGQAFASVWATCGPGRRLTSELLTLADAQGLVDRWCRWHVQPVENSRPAGRALICGRPVGGAQG
jgi:hypothetical protein